MVSKGEDGKVCNESIHDSDAAKSWNVSEAAAAVAAEVSDGSAEAEQIRSELSEVDQSKGRHPIELNLSRGRLGSAL